MVKTNNVLSFLNNLEHISHYCPRCEKAIFRRQKGEVLIEETHSIEDCVKELCRRISTLESK